MELKGKTVGFAMTGSFCTFARVIKEVEKLSVTDANIIPIMSETAYSTDTRFGNAQDFIARLQMICGNPVIKSVKEAEPIGPKSYLDLLIIAPCTGNTLAKLANGIADSSVTMAAKAHLRGGKPVLIAVSTNDGLGNAAKNIGFLLNSKHIYLVPFGQDDCEKKPNSLVADMTKIIPCAELALEGKQLQPILC
ncbi:MAG: dipicolinate synthase subunit B [Clostridia bacterium]|nr:dipicolinate synthase subunit B [Clostridia bacterium]MBQ7751393.1 dipicolinate synthase subunit B [Clostridia bacterium]